MNRMQQGDESRFGFRELISNQRDYNNLICVICGFFFLISGIAALNLWGVSCMQPSHSDKSPSSAFMALQTTTLSHPLKDLTGVHMNLKVFAVVMQTLGFYRHVIRLALTLGLCHNLYRNPHRSQVITFDRTEKQKL